VGRPVKPQHLMDRMSNLRSIEPVHQTVLKVLSAIDGDEPEHQALALGVAFVELIDVFQLDPRRVLNTAENVIRAARFSDSLHFNAIRNYIEGELLNGG
jgi:hypothetical protein